MRRGTTPTHTFITDMDLSAAKRIYITYNQNGRTVIEKSIEDITFGENSLSVTLSQQDTLLFSSSGSVMVQIRALFEDDTAVASQIITTSADKILKDGVI